MSQITLDILKQLCPKTDVVKLQNFLTSHNEYGHILELNTKTRTHYFLAQIAHETDCFKSIVEYEDGSKYEGNKNLGNIQKGDGKKYKGRGYIMLTGRWNYTDFQRWLNKVFPSNKYDVINKPETVGTDLTLAYLTIPYFWLFKKLNQFADLEDKNGHPADDPYLNFNKLTERINGGQNGKNDRVSKLLTIKKLII